MGSSANTSAIGELRIKIQDVIQEDARFNVDYYLRMWLKAAKLDVLKAESMIRNSVEWRKENDVNSDLTNPETPPVLVTDFKVTFIERPEDGYLVMYLNFGAMDLRGKCNTYGRNKVVSHFAKTCVLMEETLLSFSKSCGPITGNREPRLGMVGILNIEGFDSKQLCSFQTLKVLSEMMTLLITHFPGILSLAIIVNMNKFFGVAFRVLEPMLRTCMDVEVFVDPKEGKERALEFIELEQWTALCGVEAEMQD